MEEIRILENTPPCKVFRVDGQPEWCVPTGYEVCKGDPENPGDWWIEYIDAFDGLHYGR